MEIASLRECYKNDNAVKLKKYICEVFLKNKMNNNSCTFFYSDIVYIARHKSYKCLKMLFMYNIMNPTSTLTQLVRSSYILFKRLDGELVNLLSLANVDNIENYMTLVMTLFAHNYPYYAMNLLEKGNIDMKEFFKSKIRGYRIFKYILDYECYDAIKWVIDQFIENENDTIDILLPSPVIDTHKWNLFKRIKNKDKKHLEEIAMSTTYNQAKILSLLLSTLGKYVSVNNLISNGEFKYIVLVAIAMRQCMDVKIIDHIDLLDYYDIPLEDTHSEILAAEIAKIILAITNHEFDIFKKYIRKHGSDIIYNPKNNNAPLIDYMRTELVSNIALARKFYLFLYEELYMPVNMTITSWFTNSMVLNIGAYVYEYIVHPDPLDDSTSSMDFIPFVYRDDKIEDIIEEENEENTDKIRLRNALIASGEQFKPLYQWITKSYHAPTFRNQEEYDIQIDVRSVNQKRALGIPVYIYDDKKETIIYEAPMRLMHITKCSIRKHLSLIHGAHQNLLPIIAQLKDHIPGVLYSHLTEYLYPKRSYRKIAPTMKMISKNL